ncbi:restriction modification system DNA specificity domain-containing protein [Caldithrix abyssi DSM 13497]|uniref:Restriction modification system DNA specificity domain-containing protein n=1 Tax=Caldithrix abyssi DSM 13497 TaxID=880073 RepID=H1XYK4_CALAY|nr:restriction endonuclease subunit S [Caldithrix abyssi]APF19710.1 type I restriction enzyme, S subunit [Caldithrix abyssi DSM 13497]EHO39822.1 restriction modification system DNA specificity domain-containing protein [Caldithrix abyssi DSM 13497]
MIKKLKPYPQYKDSGVPWLGKVPAHWEVFPNRALFVEINDQNNLNEQLLSVTINSGVIQQRELLNVSSKKDSSRIDKSNYKLVMPGDIVYNKMRAWQGAIGLSQYRGIVSPAYVVQKPKYQESGRFFHYLFRTPLFIKEAERWSYGITSDMWSLRPEHFKLIYSPLPPLPEQQAIVRFLDWAERRIRKAIRLRQRRIKLLQEYKQALIHQAVTGQIDVRTGQPYQEYKDSGVEWLGKVPKHWEVVRLKYVARLKSGESITSENIEETGKFPVYGGNGLRGYTNAYTHEGEFVLIGRQGALCGNINYASGKFWASEHAVVAQPKLKFSVRWFGELLRIMNLNQYSMAAAQPGLAVERIQNLKIPFPSIKEQETIDRFINEQIVSFDAAIAATRRAIELLKELRTTLIAEVVTGKLDVREAAAQLPETPESEMEDLAEIEEETPEPQEEEPLLQEEADD